MNDRHNRIAGCQSAVDAARAQMDIHAKLVADSMLAWEDGSGESKSVEQNVQAYRKASEVYAAALDDLADALRR